MHSFSMAAINLNSCLLQKSFYYIGTRVLLENTPLFKFIQNYIWDSSGVFSVFSLVKVMSSLEATFM